MLADLNQLIVVLQVFALDPNGAEKTNVVSGTVRVYTVSGGESDVLGLTALTRVGTTNKWRYEWDPAALPVGEYTIEYLLVDDNGVETSVGEDLIVRDIAQQVTLADVRSRVILLQTDMVIVRKMTQGRWKIENNQLFFYDDDGVTPYIVFDLKDDAGLPSMDRVFERVLP